jgi:quinoprotein glucose dehydrogenase
VHHDLWDYDVASPPVLVDFKGKPALGVLTKIGHYFLLDRMTGAPLLPVTEKPVPPSDIKGESASPTQPVPRSGVFTLQTFTPRPGWCEAEFKKLRYEGLFTPPSLGGTLVFPGNVGGANWGGGVYDPKRGLIFVAANRLATAVRLVPRETFDRSGHGDTGERIGVEYAKQESTPYGMSRRTFLGPDGKPCNVEPWGAIAAIEVATGKLRWETPTTVSLGGPLQVGGLVIFGGDLWVSKLKAYSADDGQKVWEMSLPHPANSVPGTYVWKGQRFIVVAAGGHGKVNQDKGDEVVAFTLH